MKKKGIIVLAAVLVLVTAGAAAAAIFFGKGAAAERNEYEKKLLGKWAYIHDPDTRVALFQANGKAEFEGTKYQFSSDGESILFTAGSEEVLRLRYEQPDEDQICLYLKSKYVPMSGFSTNGIVGVWVCNERGWTYEFTDKGTFMEDGVLTGYYFVDEESGTIKLVYERALEDTVFYYRLENDELYVEYPWLMNRM